MNHQTNISDERQAALDDQAQSQRRADQREVAKKKSEIIARRAKRKLYDREKTIAMVTGVICALIFFGGTSLGSYHAFIMLGIFAGVLATASYLIADAVIIWASVVDYHEDKTPMEWAAWLVKYGLSLYMLIAGGCIAYKLFTGGEAEVALSQRASGTSQAYTDCMKNAKTKAARAGCQSLAKTYNQTEAERADAKTAKERPEWVDKFTNHPLFNYLPGILGLIGAAFLTLVSKLFPQKVDGAEDELLKEEPTISQRRDLWDDPGTRAELRRMLADLDAEEATHARLGTVRPDGTRRPVMGMAPQPAAAADRAARLETPTSKAEFRAPTAVPNDAHLDPSGIEKAESAPEAATRYNTRQKDAGKDEAATGNSRATATGNNRVGQPGKKPAEKPLTITGYHWRSDGAGWELRKTIIKGGKRTHRYIAHLSKATYRELTRQHKGKALADALAAWVAKREREKQ